ncbi:MAG: AAA family ATPase [Deltaproteobacteria bacterium]|nr:AAA family ATPase [Deltaproteobacteria bacterium]
MSSPVVIPIAGGKGGIGKSLIAANTAVSLAREGHKVVAIDLDLGASNLHVLFGIKNSSKNILNFANSTENDLESAVTITEYYGTAIVCGAANVAGGSNISPRQKMKILRSIETLSYDYVILDLGAGSSFNVTDFFLVGKQGVLVIVPEITSLLDAYSMLKSTIHRKLQMEWQSIPEVAVLIDEFRNPANDKKMVTIEHLINEVEKVSSEEAHRMRLMIAGFGVKLVLNKVKEQKDFKVVKTLQDLSRKNLSLDVLNVGFIPESAAIARSVNQMVPFIHFEPDGYASKQMALVTKTLASDYSQFAS